MEKRFVCIWFRYLTTDWHCRRHPLHKELPFVLTLPDHGRMVVTAANAAAEKEGIFIGISVADARAIIPSLEVADDNAAFPEQLLARFAKWLIRYSPVVAIEKPDSVVLDASGCCHLWGGERQYLTSIYTRITDAGYHIQAAIADTVGTAWAMARFGKEMHIVQPGRQYEALSELPPAALRIESDITEKLQKLGLRQIKSFMNMPATALRRRFGEHLLKRLHQALGTEEEMIEPVQPVIPYHERLQCLEPIVTAAGIEIALKRLLESLCQRLFKESKGLRKTVFKGFRVDGKIEQIEIGTNRPSYNNKHIYKLFETKIDSIEPALGIELFTLDAYKVEDVLPSQVKLWESCGGLLDNSLAELLDRIEVKMGGNCVHRYVPAEHYWPERSFKPATSLNEESKTSWQTSKQRPLKILSEPEIIEVTAPIPDYPPLTFRYKGILHKIIKSDGPERIEQEWWLQQGQHRDYYYVEDEKGQRYWLFRLGHYDVEKSYKWFIHGFFA